LAHGSGHRISWQEKATSIAAIAADLNIGRDRRVFLDDTPVERAKVRAALPDVLCPEMPADPSRYRDALLELDVFEALAVTDEDRVSIGAKAGCSPTKKRSGRGC
jgi:predicted enzyme involved in methoxymalonyl-ACP biosynthesis